MNHIQFLGNRLKDRTLFVYRIPAKIECSACVNIMLLFLEIFTELGFTKIYSKTHGQRDAFFSYYNIQTAQVVMMKANYYTWQSV